MTTEEVDREISGGMVNLAEEANRYFSACAKAAALVTAKRLEAQAQIENEAISEVNQRVAHAISSIAGVEFNEVPHDLWAWWDNYNETDYQSSKFDRRRYNDATFVARMDYYYEPQVRESRRLLSESVSYGSCFVAGTRVWTLRGSRPIEFLMAGDLVLSRSVDTGELCFKPVVASTTRQPAKTVILEVGEDKLHATTSHLLWVSGKGWTKCGEIEPGDLLHSSAEPAVVTSKQVGPVLPTHNVIVADNHTYFVGNSQVLSHDVVPRSAAHELVPGQFAYVDGPN